MATSTADAVTEYAAAFQKFDLDVLTLDTKEAAQRFRIGHRRAVAGGAGRLAAAARYRQ